MVKISYDDFMKLSDEKKCLRYKNMNYYDRQRARMSEPMVCGKSIGYIELTVEQKARGKETIEKIMKIGTSKQKSI